MSPEDYVGRGAYAQRHAEARRKLFRKIKQVDMAREIKEEIDIGESINATNTWQRMMTEEPETYQRMLQSLIFKAQQSNNEKLLENPYLQMLDILQLSNDLGSLL